MSWGCFPLNEGGDYYKMKINEIHKIKQTLNIIFASQKIRSKIL